ncbi:hypothetical protein DL98DRAFT_506872 [Cadophora sp. DSE1049]|nr:hypothetical protein DL98DRAFT_506872 [Cadophora sp. DSE1049]
MAVPPLPDVLPREDSPAEISQTIRSGCWFISVAEDPEFPLGNNPQRNPFHYCDGTLRVEDTGSGRRASGDLYLRQRFWEEFEQDPLETTHESDTHDSVALAAPLGQWVWIDPPSPSKGIPIQPIGQYRCYVRITKINEVSGGFQLGLELYRYNAVSKTNFSFTFDHAFSSVSEDTTYTAKMRWTTDGLPNASQYPSPRDCAVGTLVRDKDGKTFGRFRMGWVSNYYRKCSVEIDSCVDCPQPVDNGGSENWKTVFDRVNWDIAVNSSDRNVPDTSIGTWTIAEAHKAMEDHRSTVNLDAEWVYYLLVVPKFDPTYDFFGIMFDRTTADGTGVDPNNVAREGSVIEEKYLLGNEEGWGSFKGKNIGDVPVPFFRSSVHEVGHALGLPHDDDVSASDCSIMNQTINILDLASKETPFESLIKWNFSDAGLEKLRHYSDVFVRPGGVEWSFASETNPPLSPDEASVVQLQGLELEVKPLLTELPLGAPVRVDITLKNNSSRTVTVPADIDLKSGNLSGTVRHQSAVAREFHSMARYNRRKPWKTLKPKGSKSASMTLLYGNDGALFQGIGISEITVKLQWNLVEGTVAAISGRTTVLVMPPVDTSHAAAAHRILTTPQVNTVLAIGGDHATDGISAVQQALEDLTLKPHFACMEAKRLSKNFFDRPVDPAAAQSVLDGCGAVVVSDTEKTKLSALGLKLG